MSVIWITIEGRMDGEVVISRETEEFYFQRVLILPVQNWNVTRLRQETQIPGMCVVLDNEASVVMLRQNPWGLNYCYLVAVGVVTTAEICLLVASRSNHNLIYKI